MQAGIDRLQTMTPDEQRNEIRALIAFYDERGWDWLHIVSYHAAVFTGHWPPPKPFRKVGGRPRKEIGAK
jgi:hypothetical protein